jgi:hypothetical protein
MAYDGMQPPLAARLLGLSDIAMIITPLSPAII